IPPFHGAQNPHPTAAGPPRTKMTQSIRLFMRVDSTAMAGQSRRRRQRIPALQRSLRMTEDSEYFRLAHTKLTLNHRLARTGLMGTLLGACSTLLAIVLVVGIQTITERYVLEGWPLATLAAVVGVAVIFMGAFIFDRTLDFSAETDKNYSMKFRLTA